MFKQTFINVALLAACLLGTGCVQRTLHVDSNPPGALVYLNDEFVGRTPTSVVFTWYGTYDVRLEKEGYQALSTSREAKQPLYDMPFIDVFAEAMPGTVHSDVHWSFDLHAKEPVNESELVQRAKALKSRLGSD